MSFKRIVEVLQEIGFSKIDAEVYIYLSKEGPKTTKELAHVLMMTKRQIQQALKSLELKDAIISNTDRKFSAVIFEELLLNYIRKEKTMAGELVKNKEELLSSWIELAENKKPITRIN